VASDLDAMGKARFFLGPIGAASKMKIVVNMVMGGMLACFVSQLHSAGSVDVQTGHSGLDALT
jgi:glyoxylate/succinic semialdehyde reductase